MFSSTGVECPTWLPNPSSPVNDFGFINVIPSGWFSSLSFKGTEQEEVTSYSRNQVYSTVTLRNGEYKEATLTHRIAHVAPLKYVYPSTSTAWEYIVSLKVEHEGCCTCSCTVTLVKGIAPDADTAMKHVDYHLSFFQFVDVSTAF